MLTSSAVRTTWSATTGTTPSSRDALKIKPNYVPARMVLARAFLGKGIVDEALNNVQEAATVEPKNPAVLDMQANIELQQAFNTFNTGGSREDTLKAIRTAMSAAVNARRTVLDAQVDAMTLDPANPVPYADTAIKAGRYSAAISALSGPFKKDNRRVDLGNRLAYAQMRSLRLTDAQNTVSLMLKFGKPDAYTYAIASVLDYESGDEATSTNMLQQAILNDSSNVGVRTAQAYLALRHNRTKTLTPIARDLAGDEGNRSEVAYFLSALYNRAGDYGNSRKYFERALLTEPTNVDVYVEQANRAIEVAMSGKQSDPGKAASPADEKKEVAFQLEQAASYYEIARLARPESPQALTGLAIVAMLQNKPSDAARFGEAAAKAGPEYSPGLYTYAGALQTQIQALLAMATRNRQDADAAGGEAGKTKRQQATDMERSAGDMINASHDLLARAAKLDPNDLGGRQAPTAVEAYRYYARHGQTPVMSAP
jgi:tetratricopeptide (TPR) repeat protein